MTYATSGALYAEVVETARLSPHLVRIVLGGEEMPQYRPLEVADEAVVLWFPKPGEDRPAPTTLKDGVWGHHDPRRLRPDATTRCARSRTAG